MYVSTVRALAAMMVQPMAAVQPVGQVDGVENPINTK